jgi:cation diffusion facilitator CzcD-associated flavoprotein CzcO
MTPKYPLGCKRVLASNDFYPAMQRANVELVTDPIAEITATGLRTKDGRHREVDAIIYSTGFKPAEYLSALKVHGLDGREIHDVWDGAPQAYVGAAMHGFPNFFMLYGPHTNGSGSIIYMLEAECEFVTKCIVEQRRRGADMIQPGAEAQRAYNVMIDQRLEKMPVSLPGCNSYFKTKTGKIATQWPARMSDYDHRARHPDWNDFLFETTHAPQRAAPVLEPAK